MDIVKKNNNDAKEKNVESTRGYFYASPDCDIYETDAQYRIVFEIPGIDKDEIGLKVEKDVLTLTADCSKEPANCNECLSAEMDFVGYSRSFNLNNLINADKIDANYDDGILTLTLPKKEEQKSKEIKINIT